MLTRDTSAADENVNGTWGREGRGGGSSQISSGCCGCCGVVWCGLQQTAAPTSVFDDALHGLLYRRIVANISHAEVNGLVIVLTVLGDFHQRLCAVMFG